MQNNNKDYLRLTSAASLLSGIVGRLIFYPLDTIKAKLYVQRDTNLASIIKTSIEVSSITIVKSTIKEEGIRGLYRGLAISVVKSHL